MTTAFNYPHFLARYGKDRSTTFKQNPFTECLPPLPSDDAIRAGLLQVEEATDEMRRRPAQWRIQELDALEEFFIPLPRHVRFVRAALKLMFTGYRPRNPYDPSDWAIEQAMYEAQIAGGFGSTTAKSKKAELSMGLIGSSGCGKSFTIKHLAQKYQTPIYHEALGKWQLPMLTLEMPFDGESVHTMATAIFDAIDSRLPGGDYAELNKVGSRRNNAELRLYRAFRLARILGVGLIFIDEAQNQRSIGNATERELADELEGRRVRRGRPRMMDEPRKETPLAKLLVTATNTSHIPLVMAGTMEMPTILGERYTKRRRVSGRGSSFWTPLVPTFDLDRNRVGEFEVMMQGLWRYQLVKYPVPLTRTLLKLFYQRTGGIPDSMVKLYSSVQECAIANGTERITPELVEQVFLEEHQATALAIRGIVQNDESIQSMTPDLHRRRSVLDKPPRSSSNNARAPEETSRTTPAKRGLGRPPRPLPQAERIKMPPGFMRDAVLNGTSPVGSKRRPTP
jgi:hypothetical protein